MCDQDQEEKFVAPGYDENLHTCDQCTDTGISLEDFDYCKSCRMGPRIKQLDAFAKQLQSHDFTSAMRIVFRSTMRTEKALAAADTALLTVKCREQAAKIAELEHANENMHQAMQEQSELVGRLTRELNTMTNEKQPFAYGSSTKKNSLMSKAQFDNCAPKNRIAYDIALYPAAHQPPVDSKIAANNLNQEGK